MNSIASKIEVGRGVYFSAGYGGTDGHGVIVAVHGAPNPAPAQTIHGGIGRIIRANDCKVDVILFDGRRLSGVNQCGIDAVGIGIKLRDEVHSAATVANAHQLAAKRAAEDALAKVSARDTFERTEAARVIAAAPLFYWNGIKDAKGEKLQRCWYSASSMQDMPEGTITIYARDYARFSGLVRSCFAVQNDTDIMVDYFDNDRIRVIPAHPLYPQVRAAMDACAAHSAKRAAKRNGGAA